MVTVVAISPIVTVLIVVAEALGDASVDEEKGSRDSRVDGQDHGGHHQPSVHAVRAPH